MGMADSVVPRPGSAERLSRMIQVPTVSAEPPTSGLAPFEDTELDALYFFGRERDTEIVVANLIASRLLPR